MDLLELGGKLLKDKMGDLDNDTISSLLGGVLGGGDAAKLDLGGFVDKLKGSNLGNLADSWLGDGDNDEISPEQMKEIVGADKIKELAEKSGKDEDSLLDGLRDVVPRLIDQSSKGGSLLDSLGGLGGIAGMAKKFLD